MNYQSSTELLAIQDASVGEQLVIKGVITKQQLGVVTKQMRHMQDLGKLHSFADLCVRNRFCTLEEVSAAFVAGSASALEVGLSAASTEVEGLLSASDCLRFAVIPVRMIGKVLHVKSALPIEPHIEAAILDASLTNAEELRVVLTDRHEVSGFLRQRMANESFESALNRLRADDGSLNMIRSAIDSLLHEAIDKRASDIRIDYKPDPYSWISYRIDGDLRQEYLLPSRLMAALVSRFKTLCEMDASNSRSAQDGRLSLEHHGRRVDFRVATQPLVDGETVAVRVIDAAALPTPETLYPHQPEMLAMLRKLSMSDGKIGGLVFVTGPTGSGKSSTLYTMAASFPRDRANVLTVEDPVENLLPFSRQIQVQQQTMQRAVDIERSVLRQDPDILVMGEVRDSDTATTALKFSESGHLVLTTLHAKSAPQSLDRFINMLSGMARAEAGYLLATTVQVVINQRLFPRLCSCAVQAPAGDPEKECIEAYLGSKISSKRAKGCHRCEESGYRGRVAIHETLIFDFSEGERAALAAEVARTESIGVLLDSPSVRHIKRSSVAQILLQAGVIDARQAMRALEIYRPVTRDAMHVSQDSVPEAL